MSAPPESPPSGGRWLGNAEAFERSRQRSQDLADAYGREGHERRASYWQGHADAWRERRDEEQRAEEDRRRRAASFRRS